MNLESLRIALGGLMANRMRSFLTVLGMLIGVAAVIILVAVGSGSEAATAARLESLGSNTLTISAGGFGFGRNQGTRSATVSLTDKDVRNLANQAQAPDIKAVVPTVSTASPPRTRVRPTPRAPSTAPRPTSRRCGTTT